MRRPLRPGHAPRSRRFRHRWVWAAWTPWTRWTPSRTLDSRACYDETDYPVVFATGLEAQREVADNQLTRIQEFLDGQRDYDDAMTTDEFILPVDVWPDRRVSIEDGSIFGKVE
jgi:hypothetical protein